MYFVRKRWPRWVRSAPRWRAARVKGRVWCFGGCESVVPVALKQGQRRAEQGGSKAIAVQQSNSKKKNRLWYGQVGEGNVVTRAHEYTYVYFIFISFDMHTNRVVSETPNQRNHNRGASEHFLLPYHNTAGKAKYCAPNATSQRVPEFGRGTTDNPGPKKTGKVRRKKSVTLMSAR